MGHRQILPLDNKYIHDTQSFYSYVKFREAPTPKSSSHTVVQIEDYKNKK